MPTELPFKKGNKRAAERILDQLRSAYNIYGELIEDDESSPCERNTETLPIVKGSINPNEMLFADYMLYWLSYKETEVDPVTYVGYCNSVENFVYPYFKELGVTLQELQPSHLKQFYLYERKADPETG